MRELDNTLLGIVRPVFSTLAGILGPAANYVIPGLLVWAMWYAVGQSRYLRRYRLGAMVVMGLVYVIGKAYR